jgi:hypothetical protein
MTTIASASNSTTARAITAASEIACRRREVTCDGAGTATC